jgi:hypothetical protein
MSEGRTDVFSMYCDSRNGRLSGTAASVGLLEEPFESEDWNVDWARPRSSDVSSLTVQTLIAQPSGAATSVRSEFSERASGVGEAQWHELDALEAARRLDALLTRPIAGLVLAVQSRRIGARFQWRSADAVVTLAVHSANPAVSNSERSATVHAALKAQQPATDRAKARALLKSWLWEDVNTSDQSMELLKAQLDKDLESGRKLFP